jgi:hypothetical protein
MNGVAHDAIIIGHGDWKFNPDTQDASFDRQLQLTLVIFQPFKQNKLRF